MAIEKRWQQLIFKGEAVPRLTKSTEQEAVAFVSQHQGAIAYVSYAVDLPSSGASLASPPSVPNRPTKSARRISVFLAGFMALATAPAHAQRSVSTSGYDKHLPPLSSVSTLRNDLRRLDLQLNAIRPREEYAGLARVAAAIRSDLRVLEDQMKEHIEGRHDGQVGGLAEVNWLRQRVLELRGSITALPPAQHR